MCEQCRLSAARATYSRENKRGRDPGPQDETGEVNPYTIDEETFNKSISNLFNMPFFRFVRLTCFYKCTQELYKDTLAALQELLKSVLAKGPTPDGLQSVFKVDGTSQ